jgi:hypothetical protein
MAPPGIGSNPISAGIREIDTFGLGKISFIAEVNLLESPLLLIVSPRRYIENIVIITFQNSQSEIVVENELKYILRGINRIIPIVTMAITRESVIFLKSLIVIARRARPVITAIVFI